MNFLYPQIGKFVRFGLAAVGGALVSKGVVDQGTVDQAASSLTEIVLGGVSFGVSYIWSLFHDKALKNKK